MWLALYAAALSGAMAAQAEEPDPKWVAEFSATVADEAIEQYRQRLGARNG